MPTESHVSTHTISHTSGIIYHTFYLPKSHFVIVSWLSHSCLATYSLLVFIISLIMITFEINITLEKKYIYI